METLNEVLNRTLDLVRLEIQEARLLPTQYKKALVNYIGGGLSNQDLYFTSSSLITTNKEDAEALMMRAEGCEILFKFESEHFAIGFYFINIIENKGLFNLIGGIT